MRRYEEYKQSGIDWLPTIPKNWQLKRIDEVAKIVRGNCSFKRDELLEEGTYVALQYGKTYQVDEINHSFNFYVNDEFYKSNQIVKQGDTILISTSETIEDLGHSCFFNRKDLGLLGGEQLMLKPNNKLVSPKFLYYFSKYYRNEIKKYATGLKVYRYNIDDLKNIFVPVFSVTEQQAIANYLDAKTQAIDKKVSLLEQKIETYKKLKRTLINQTITKGLNKNAPLKDSGIAWIGQIPQHWEVKRLKELGNIETSSINKKIEEGEDLVKLVNYTDVYSNLKREIWNNDNYMIVSANKLQISSKKLKQGDVLFTPSSETINDIGVSAVVMENLHNTLYSYHLLRLRFRKVVDLHFKKYLFSNDYVQYYFSKSATGTTRKILGLNTFNNLMIPLPPKSEQEEIAKYLDHKTTTIDAIVGNISKQIETLKQLRKTLINDVVTGKIKVVE